MQGCSGRCNSNIDVNVNADDVKMPKQVQSIERKAAAIAKLPESQEWIKARAKPSSKNLTYKSMGNVYWRKRYAGTADHLQGTAAGNDVNGNCAGRAGSICV